MMHHHLRRWEDVGSEERGVAVYLLSKVSLLLVLQVHFNILLDAAQNWKSQVYHSHLSPDYSPGRICNPEPSLLFHFPNTQ